MRKNRTDGGTYNADFDAIICPEGWGPGDAVYVFGVCDDCGLWFGNAHGGGCAWRYLFADCCYCDDESASFLFAEEERNLRFDEAGRTITKA